MSRNNLNGVIAAVPTPIDINGVPDLNKFLTHARWALDNGCDGLNILGTTGEANSFSPEKRKAVMAAGAAELEVSALMVGTGTPDFETTEMLTLYAAELGFAGALILPPYYYKPASDNALYDWYARLAGTVSKTDISLYLYNFPALTGITLSLDLLTRLAADFPGRICGIKDSSGDIAFCREITQNIEDFSVFPSSETSLPTARHNGFAGCISATVNLTAPASQLAWQNKDQGKEAAFTKKLLALRSAISSTPLIPSIKYLISQRYHDADWRHLRPPLQPLSNAEKTALDEGYQQLTMPSIIS